MAEPPLLPAHIESTIEALVQLHAEHHKQATSFQRAMDRLRARASRPSSLAVITLLVSSWMAINVALIAAGRKPFDEPPFFWMQGAVALAALYTTIFVLVTQRREDELATRREQLTLQLAILSEKKAAKIISLLEELRQDHPDIQDRKDRTATEMAAPSDPRAVLDAVRKRHDEATAGSELIASRADLTSTRAASP